MTLKDSLKPYILAAFSGLWVQTHEPDEAQREIARLCSDEGWHHQHWNMAQGEVTSGAAGGDPQAALELLSPKPDQTSVLPLRRYYRFLNNPMAVERLFNRVCPTTTERARPTLRDVDR